MMPVKSSFGTKFLSTMFFVFLSQLFLILVTNFVGHQGERAVRFRATEAFYVIINNGSFNETLNTKDIFEFIPSVEGMPDIPNWMHYRFPNGSHAYLYGTAPKAHNLSIEIIALNTRTFDYYRDTLNMYVVEKEDTAKYEIEIRLNNFNVEDMFFSRRWEDLLSIFRDNLWKDSLSVYFTSILAPEDVGRSLPPNPRDKEGVIIRIGSTNTYSRELIELEREVKPIKVRNPCPPRYKFTRFEHVFRSKGFICDWCSFLILRNGP